MKIQNVEKKPQQSEPYVCECKETHPDLVKKTQSQMPSIETLYDLSEFFKVFADSTRIRILCALFESEMCVCDIAELLEMGQSAISHQLRLLRTSHLVRTRREGKTVYYALDDEHIRLIFNQGLEHILHRRYSHDQKV